MLDKLNKITAWQASIIITILGFAVYFEGLKNQFLGDDSGQIVTNVPVHSISNIRLFFEGGTFYIGNGLKPLAGSYFRPLITTVFSLIYTIFGPHPFYFHLIQLLLCIGSAIILYLFFRYSFTPVLALFLSIIFLVHPIDSQVVFSIASMQDALFFFFGILAMYLLIRFKSLRGLIAVAVCLLLSLLSKETGVLFVAVALLYLYWFDQRKRLYKFSGVMVIPIALYLILKINAIGFIGANPNNAPIDKLNLVSRLYTAPSILLFYAYRFIFPLHLAHAYYWVFPKFSINNVLLPLVLDIAVVAIAVYVALLIRNRGSKANYYTYLLFSVWAVIGLLLCLQIIPLDMTACETWFYFSMAGVLGMIGMVVVTLGKSIHINQDVLILIIIAIVALLGVRTSIRGLNWSNNYTLASHDIKVSTDDYVADNIMASNLTTQGNLEQALIYSNRSISIFPTGEDYNTLGLIYYRMGNYDKSEQSYINGLRLGNNPQTKNSLFDNAAIVRVLYGNQTGIIQFLERGIDYFPKDSNLWLYLAIEEYKSGYVTDAKSAIIRAYSYNPGNNEIRTAYTIIMNNKKLILQSP